MKHPDKENPTTEDFEKKFGPFKRKIKSFFEEWKEMSYHQDWIDESCRLSRTERRLPEEMKEKP